MLTDSTKFTCSIKSTEMVPISKYLHVGCISLSFIVNYVRIDFEIKRLS